MERRASNLAKARTKTHAAMTGLGHIREHPPGFVGCPDDGVPGSGKESGPMNLGKKGDAPCLVCGARRYTWGYVGAQGLNFTPNDASLLRKFFKVGWKLPARRCDDCGNFQLFATMPEGDG
jgi:hypothetical protein